MTEEAISRVEYEARNKELHQAVQALADAVAALTRQETSILTDMAEVKGWIRAGVVVISVFTAVLTSGYIFHF